MKKKVVLGGSTRGRSEIFWWNKQTNKESKTAVGEAAFKNKVVSYFLKLTTATTTTTTTSTTIWIPRIAKTSWQHTNI